MFWKKKKPETDEIIHSSEDQRVTYRYHFKNGQGFKIKFKEKVVTIINISAGGLSFINNDFQQFDFDSIKFTIDIPNFRGESTFSAGLRILRIDKDEVCHCIFEQCQLEQYELIHKYVLEMQKNDLTH
mgnify:CR=1 FL=1